MENKWNENQQMLRLILDRLPPPTQQGQQQNHTITQHDTSSKDCEMEQEDNNIANSGSAIVQYKDFPPTKDHPNQHHQIKEGTSKKPKICDASKNQSAPTQQQKMNNDVR